MNSITVGNLKAILSLDTTNFDKGVTSSEANAKKLADRLSKDLAPSQARINSLIRDFAGNKDIARALEYATAVEKIGGANKLTEQRQAETNRAVQKGLDTYRALGIEAPKSLTDLANATKQAHKPIDDLVSKAKSLAGVFGVTLGVGALIGFAKSTLDAADQIGDLALKMGVSTDAAQRFGYAARQSGANIDDVSQAIVKMNDNLGTGDKSTVAALDAAGLRFERIRNMKPEDAFREIADAIGRVPDPMTQARIAMDLFGKAGATLLPMIRENSLAVADGAEIMSEDTIKALKDAKQAWENFFGWLTVESGNVIADIATLWRNLGAIITGELGKIKVPKVTREPTFGEALTNPFGAAKMRFEHALSPFAKMGQDVDAAFASMPTMGRPALFNQQTDDVLARAHSKAVTVIDDHIKAKKAADDHTKAVEKLEDAYQAYARQRLTGMSDAEMMRRDHEVRFMQERGLLQAFGWSLGIVGKSPLSSLLGPGIDLGFNKPLPSMDLPMTPSKARGPMSLAELLSGVTIPGYNKRDLFGQGFSGAMGDLPQTILQAITGGGSIGKSIGSLFGSGIGGSIIGSSKDGVFKDGFGKMLQESFLGKKVGGMVASFIPGIGALLGPALGKLFSSIGNIGANNTKKDRESFAKESGFESLDNLYSKLRSLGTEGEKLANIGLNVIGKKDRAANEKWMKDVTAFFDRLEKVPGKVNELSQALGKFGGAIPKQLDPLLDSILADKNLDPALRRQLEGMRKPSWQAAQDFASSVGINLGALGPGFNQSRLADQAFSLKRGIDLLSRFAGSDQNAILRDMADEFSALAQDAKKNNVALPRAVQAFLRQIDEMGLLLDENGDRLDLSLLQFADIEDESMKEVVSLLEQIRDLLSPRPAPTPGAPGGPGGPPRPAPPTDPDNPDPGDPYDPRGPIRQPDLSGFGALSLPDIGDMPGFGGFGGTGQAVTAAGANVSIYAIDAASFETFMSQRGGAEVVVRTMGPVIERWGKAQ